MAVTMWIASSAAELDRIELESIVHNAAPGDFARQFPI
jgi:hypothetical protein